jgi:hypothetical protein
MDGMITSYSELKTSIAAFLHRTDLTAMIPEFIADAEARIYDDLRIRAMEAAFTATTSGGTVALPTGFLEWIYLYADVSPLSKLQRKDVEWIVTNYQGNAGVPKFFARNGDNLMFGPEPSSDTALIGRYYKRLDALSDSNTSNWFIVNAPAILRFGALCEAAPYMEEDERIALWERKYQACKSRIERTDKRETGSGSLLSATKG